MFSVSISLPNGYVLSDRQAALCWTQSWEGLVGAGRDWEGQGPSHPCWASADYSAGRSRASGYSDCGPLSPGPAPAPEAHLCSFLWDWLSKMARTTTETTSSTTMAPTIPYTMLLLVLNSQLSPQCQCVSEFRHLGTHTSSGQPTSIPHPPSLPKEKNQCQSTGNQLSL